MTSQIASLQLQIEALTSRLNALESHQGDSSPDSVAATMAAPEEPPLHSRELDVLTFARPRTAINRMMNIVRSDDRETDILEIATKDVSLLPQLVLRSTRRLNKVQGKFGLIYNPLKGAQQWVPSMGSTWPTGSVEENQRRIRSMIDDLI